MTINAKTITLISAVTANSNGEAYEWAGQGLGSLQVFGTFDTCTVTMQGSLDGGVPGQLSLAKLLQQLLLLHLARLIV